MNRQPRSTRRFGKDGTQTYADWLGKTDMADDAAAKKSMILSSASAVKKLIWQNDLARVVFLLQTTHSGHADQPANINAAQRPEIRPMVDFGRQQSMTPTMAW